MLLTESMKQIFGAFGLRLNAIARRYVRPEQFDDFVEDFRCEFRATMTELGH